MGKRERSQLYFRHKDTLRTYSQATTNSSAMCVSLSSSLCLLPNTRPVCQQLPSNDSHALDIPSPPFLLSQHHLFPVLCFPACPLWHPCRLPLAPLILLRGEAGPDEAPPRWIGYSRWKLCTGEAPLNSGAGLLMTTLSLSMRTTVRSGFVAMPSPCTMSGSDALATDGDTGSTSSARAFSLLISALKHLVTPPSTLLCVDA